MYLNWMTVRIETTKSRITDCAADDPRSWPTKPSEKDLVDQDGGRLLRSARGDRVDHTEGFEKGIDDVDHQKEKGHRRQQRKNDRPEPFPEPCAVDCGGLDDAARDCLKSGKKEKEIIADPTPGRRDDHQTHRLVAVQNVVPVIAQRPRYHDTTPTRVLNMKSQSTPATAGATA